MPAIALVGSGGTTMPGAWLASPSSHSKSDYPQHMQPPGEDEDLTLDVREAAEGEVQQERRAADEMLDAELLSQEPDS